MTLDELQEWEQAEADDEAESCELTGKQPVEAAEADDEDVANEARLEETVDKILRYFYGKAFKTNKKTIATRRVMNKLLSDGLQLELLWTSYQDLDRSLEHLEDSLGIMEKLLRKHPHSALSPELQDVMEDVSDFLGEWGLGQHD